MRVSVEKDDPGYPALMALGGPKAVEVYLDGHRLVKGAITADTDAGEVLVYKLDLKGRYVRNGGSGEYERETIRGAVVVMPILMGGQG